MKSPRPGILAVRTVNQYRRREVVAYLGLRYYLANKSAVRDRWAADVATHLVLTRSSPAYIKLLHFKEAKDDGLIEHREMHIPGPNECLAEAVLLQACADAGVGSEFPQNVFSYQAARTSEVRSGIYVPYFRGFRARHQAVAKACQDSPDATVLYTDIRKFYPSIPTQAANASWSAACDKVSMVAALRELGQKILQDQARVAAPGCRGVLTGPMFSHLIANLVLSEVDRKMAAGDVKYFRYVDDIILVGSAQGVKAARERLVILLAEHGFVLHDSGKDFSVSAVEWLESSDDFRDKRVRPSWKTLTGGIKHLLTMNPAARSDLMDAFGRAGIALPIPDFEAAAHEVSRVKVFAALARHAWFRRSLARLTVADLVKEALVLRQRYSINLIALAEGTASLHGFQRKRRIPKLRFYASRLTYLATPEILRQVSQLLRPIHEMRFHAEISWAISHRDVSQLISFGTNAVQSAAQALAATPFPVECRQARDGEAEKQGRAILALNGIEVRPQTHPAEADELGRFAQRDGVDTKLMTSEQAFIREVACLRGHEQLDNRTLLNTAFDFDEELALDAVNQANVSS